jgi:glucose/arabinose dehydrogenase
VLGLSKRTFLGVLVVVLAGLPGVAPAAPDAFVDTQLPTPAANPLSAPTTITPILNTGRARILEKGGAVRALSADGTMVSADALDLTACANSEEGLLGAAVDPGFAANGFVYLYDTRPTLGSCTAGTGAVNRVSRFTMTGDTINPASELVLLDNMNVPAGNHNGGDLHIGDDDDLYVSVGDGGTNPRGSGTAAQDLSLLNGKILRITTTGGVPADNPFVGLPGPVVRDGRDHRTDDREVHRDLRLRAAQPVSLRLRSEHDAQPILHQRHG